MQVYPVPMRIRATNVSTSLLVVYGLPLGSFQCHIHRYEERSLASGVFEAPVNDITESLDELEPRERIGRYLGWHLLAMGEVLRPPLAI